MKSFTNLLELAKVLNGILKTDRDVILAVGGFTGEGKSTFLIKLMQEYYKVIGRPWDFDFITWSRKELLTWVDGKPKSSFDKRTGLKEGQLPEYSGIIADELFSMFYRRTWFESGQIDAIATFNMCRDRHLLVGGNIPNFWELDNGFLSRVRFYVYIPKRGLAWIFQQENNPFTSDPWNINENRKVFRKKGNPFSCKNFVCELTFNDLNPKEKEVYLSIRNHKRLAAIKENSSARIERYNQVKIQRDKLIRLYYKEHVKESSQGLADYLELSNETIRLVRQLEASDSNI